MARPGFMVYFADWQPLEALDDAQFRAVFRAAFAFAQTGENISVDDSVAKMTWLMLRPRIEADAAKYANKVEKARVAGRISAEQRTGNVVSDKESTSTVVDGCQRTPTDSNGCQHFQPTESLIINSTESPTQLNESVKRESFTPPTLDEVQTYAREMDYAGFNADSFVSYYDSNGWKVGRNPMRDWKAAVRSWYTRNKPSMATALKEYREFNPATDW